MSCNTNNHQYQAERLAFSCGRAQQLIGFCGYFSIERSRHVQLPLTPERDQKCRRTILLRKYTRYFRPGSVTTRALTPFPVIILYVQPTPSVAENDSFKRYINASAAENRCQSPPSFEEVMKHLREGFNRTGKSSDSGQPQSEEKNITGYEEHENGRYVVFQMTIPDAIVIRNS